MIDLNNKILRESYENSKILKDYKTLLEYEQLQLKDVIYNKDKSNRTLIKQAKSLSHESLADFKNKLKNDLELEKLYKEHKNDPYYDYSKIKKILEEDYKYIEELTDQTRRLNKDFKTQRFQQKFLEDRIKELKEELPRKAKEQHVAIMNDLTKKYVEAKEAFEKTRWGKINKIKNKLGNKALIALPLTGAAIGGGITYLKNRKKNKENQQN